MTKISVCTIYARRRLHLINLIRGLNQSKLPPAELAIALMDGDLPELPTTSFPIRIARLSNSHTLPLAAARNKAAEITTTDRLIFLDLDCICDRDLVSTFDYFLNQEDALFQGSVKYLAANWTRDNWTKESLEKESAFNPLQGNPVTGKDKVSHPYELFWSLCFGVRKKTFLKLGGFDESYIGYGAEDTDFGFTARSCGLPFFKISALAYHQFHKSYSPPLNHLADIVSNALVFKHKWGILPMEKWLQQFTEMGYIKLKENSIEILRYPTDTEIAACLKDR